MLVQVLKRFEGPKKTMFEAGQVLDLECRNLQGLIDFKYLSPVEAPAALPVPVPVPVPASAPPARAKGRKAARFTQAQ